jgi:ribosome assembly protein RRB1
MDKKKRSAEETVPEPKRKAEEVDGKPVAAADEDEDEAMSDEIEYEDEYDDEFEEEEFIENEDEYEDGEGVEGEGMEDGDVKFGEMVKDEEEEDEDEDEDSGPKSVWRPSDGLEEGEELDYDPTTYEMLHSMSTNWPCLSFGFIPDALGGSRKRFPHTLFLAAGTQAGDATSNSIITMKISRLHKTKPEDSDEEDDDDDDDEPQSEVDIDPILETATVSTPAVNRLKVMPQLQKNTLVAMWADTGSVGIYDVRKYVSAVDGGATSLLAKKDPPLHLIKAHKNEGFALDWSPTVMGRLLSGDCSKFIYETDFYTGTTLEKPYDAHQGSVEDLQWSPNEKDVFASCSVDTTVKIWDARATVKKAMISVKVHKSDVNAISWNKKVPYLLASGSDDCSFCIWDLRNFKPDTEVAKFTFHEKPICSIEWNPHDESQLVVVSEDDQVTIWDMGLEADDGEEPSDFPPQLFFVHQGQHSVKEAHWHPQIPNLIGTTASDGFNLFITANATEVAPPEDKT